ELLMAFAERVARLGGTFTTGEDVGTTVADIEAILRSPLDSPLVAHRFPSTIRFAFAAFLFFSSFAPICVDPPYSPNEVSPRASCRYCDQPRIWSRYTAPPFRSVSLPNVREGQHGDPGTCGSGCLWCARRADHARSQRHRCWSDASCPSTLLCCSRSLAGGFRHGPSCRALGQ